MIVGSTMSAALYAWRLQRKCILLEPFHYHHLSEGVYDCDLTEFNVQNSIQLQSNLLTIMNITGLLKHQGNIAAFREEDKTLITKGNERIVYDCEFEMFDGKPTGKFEVFDEFYWRQGQRHNHRLIKTEDDFCRIIHLYPSRREAVNKKVKDFTVVSIMDEKQLASPDYTPGFVRIKTQRIFKENGLKGEFVMRKNNKDYFRKIKMDFASRTAVPIIEQKKSFKEVYNMKQKEGEAWIMWKRLMSREATWLA